MSRTPQPTDLTQRVLKFFSDNPGEILTITDACIKFDCTSRQFRRAVEALEGRQAIMKDFVYFLSPESLRENA
jgi:hypothetical protein